MGHHYRMAGYFFLVLLVIILYSIYFDIYQNSKLDTIFVITLERTKERAYPLCKQLVSYGYSPCLVYGIDGKSAIQNDPSLRSRFYGRENEGEIGCWLSHYYLLKHISYLPKRKKVLILEDDAYMEGPFLIPSCDFDVLYLGYLTGPFDYRQALHAFLPYLQTRGHAGTHAYCVTPEGARKIIRALNKDPSHTYSLPIDLAYISIFQKNKDIAVYSVMSENIKQREQDSVIHNTYEDHIKKEASEGLEYPAPKIVRLEHLKNEFETKK